MSDDIMSFIIQNIVILVIIIFRTPDYQRTAINFTKKYVFYKIAKMSCNVTDLAPTSVIGKWIFPSI